MRDGLEQWKRPLTDRGFSGAPLLSIDRPEEGGGLAIWQDACTQALLPMNEGKTIATDASRSGGGIVYPRPGAHGLEAYAYAFSDSLAFDTSNTYEMYTAVDGVSKLGRHSFGSSLPCRVRVLTDNQTTVSLINKGWGSSDHLCKLRTKLFSIEKEYNLNVAARHIPGALNLLADALSRFWTPLYRSRRVTPFTLGALRRHDDAFGSVTTDRDIFTFTHPEEWAKGSVNYLKGYMRSPHALLWLPSPESLAGVLRLFTQSPPPEGSHFLLVPRCTRVFWYTTVQELCASSSTAKQSRIPAYEMYFRQVTTAEWAPAWENLCVQWPHVAFCQPRAPPIRSDIDWTLVRPI
mmetsp:Transcript_22052/g.43760  ORF Transcript_22052/g.43760 Transcript_22052/m.43760 type:complete len:349 (-) Transcript_22052:17-1063(-)